jgi:ABC-2 type transport system ATP-binding protein
MSAVLTLRAGRKAFGRPVLRDDSAEVGGGESVAIVEENGSEKSTLLKVIVGLLPPDGAQVLSQGRLGYCPQELLICDRLTVRQNLRYFGVAHGLTDRQIDARPTDLFEPLNYGQYRDQRVATLSGGTRQKLNLTVALLHNPDLLVLDEPYQGFDDEIYWRF